MSLEAKIQRNNELLELQLALMEQLIIELRNGAPSAQAVSVGPALNEEQKQDRADASNDDVSIDDVRKAIVKLTDAHGRPAVVRLFTKFGANKVSELKPEDYKQVLDAIDSILADQEAA